MITNKEQVDFAVLHEIIRNSKEWLDEEFGQQSITIQDVREWVTKYAYIKGVWRVWKFEQRPIGITFHIPTAPSNSKPWLGAILIHPTYRQQGFGKQIVQELCSELKADGHSVVFAGIPYEKVGWGIFLGKCGFEQMAVQKDSAEKPYTVFGKAIE